MTFSIVAYDPNETAWGVAVASKFLAAAAVVSWAQAGAGAVATQSNAKVSFGPQGLKHMAHGVRAGAVLAALLHEDDGSSHRQVGMVDAQGGTAAHTGSECSHWAGHRIGTGFTCQGNILTGPEVLEAMEAAYLGASGELADRLYAALLAGDRAGGDRRGRQSAGLLVVRTGGGYGGDNDRYLDLRVDDDQDPVVKLGSLLRAHHLFFGATRPEDRVSVTASLAHELQKLCLRAGVTQREPDGIWDDDARRSFDRLVGIENLEERWPANDPHAVDAIVLAYLRERFPDP
ncbi:MAG: DUF1028 domain-containing protein [Anaerolineae bacterium]